MRYEQVRASVLKYRFEITYLMLHKIWLLNMNKMQKCLLLQKKETSSVFEIVFLFRKKNCLTIMSTAFELVREYNLDHFFVVRFYIQIVGRLKLNKY